MKRPCPACHVEITYHVVKLVPSNCMALVNVGEKGRAELPFSVEALNQFAHRVLPTSLPEGVIVGLPGIIPAGLLPTGQTHDRNSVAPAKVIW